MSDDTKYRDLLAVFHYIVGGLTALVSCIFLVHVGLGLAILFGAFDSADAPPRFLGLIFVIIPALAVLGGWTLGTFIIIAGRKLHRRVSHTFCLVVAGIECMLMPLGTVLGVFTIVVLMKDSVKQTFGVLR